MFLFTFYSGGWFFNCYHVLTANSDSTWKVIATAAWKTLKSECSNCQGFIGSKSFFCPSRRRECSISTWTSDSSCKTLHIDSWKGHKSLNRSFFEDFYFSICLFFKRIMGLIPASLKRPSCFQATFSKQPRNDHTTPRQFSEIALAFLGSSSY